jgi:hypothetical protein
VFQSTHDGHFWFTPDSIGKLFTFNRPFPIVSASSDGEEIPGIFSYSDVLLAAQDSTFKPSAIESIDGGSAVEYLLHLAQGGSLQDRDALWNTLFYSLPQAANGPNGIVGGVFSGGGRGRYFYPGPTTKIGFANGTEVVVRNTARVLQDFSSIGSGRDVYEKFFAVHDDMTIDLQHLQVNFTSDPRYPGKENMASSEAAKDIRAPGYPTPIVKVPQNDISGYYLSQSGYEDVAVLSMQSFEGADGQDLFQATARKFLAKAKADGKKKLIVDVSANPGGTVWLGYEIFLELFPHLEPYGASRFRAHDSWDQMGKFFSNITDGMARDPTIPAPYQDWISSPMNYRSDLNIQNKPFTSWSDKLLPYKQNGDAYTRTVRWNLDDPLIYDYSGLNNLTGRGAPSLDLPFKAEDILLVLDGYCASTCTIFAEFLRQQAGVEFLSFGGRPNEEIIQAVGGVKGSNSWGWSDILYFALNAWSWAEAPQKAAWMQSEMAGFKSYLPFKRSVGGPDLNMRDALRQDDESGIPLHFKYETTDCRMYYTADMTVDITASWRAAADVKWFGKKRCVAGGFKNVRSSSADNDDEDEAGDDEDNQRRVVRKRAKGLKSGRQTTTSVSVQQVDGGAIDELQNSLGVIADFVKSPGANAMMRPY